VSYLQGILDPIAFHNKAIKKVGYSYSMKFTKGRRFHLFSEPEIIKEIYSYSYDVLRAGEANEIFKPSLGENSLLVTDGDVHKADRKVYTKPLHGNRMHQYDELIRQLTLDLFKTVPKNKPVNLISLFSELTMQVIFRSIFGFKDEAEIAKLKLPVQEMREMNRRWGALGTFFPQSQVNLGPLTPYARFLKLQKQIHNFLDKQYEESTQKTEDIMFLSKLYMEEGCPFLKKKRIRDQMMTFLFAGQDTTTQALSWVFYWAARSPNCFEKLKKEINLTSDLALLMKNEYLNAFIKEALRIYPIFPFTVRIAQRDLILGDEYFVPKGHGVSPYIYGVHHREEIYQDSYSFRPERFLEKQYDYGQFIPFGGGNRACIGRAFAMNTMKIVLITLLQNFKLKAHLKSRNKPIRVGIGIEPSKGVYFSLE